MISERGKEPQEAQEAQEEEILAPLVVLGVPSLFGSDPFSKVKGQSARSNLRELGREVCRIRRVERLSPEVFEIFRLDSR